MTEAARIAERIMQTAIDEIGVGVRQCDVAAAIQAAGTRGTEEFGGDYPAIVPLDADGRWHLLPTHHLARRAFRRGNRHQHRDRRRQASLPRADDAHRLSRHAAGEDAQCRRCRRRGNCRRTRGGEDRERWRATSMPRGRRTIERHGLFKDSRCGYAVGLNYPPGLGRADDLAALDRRDGASSRT